MNRRGFLKLLAVLPFVPKLAEVAAASINKPINMKQVARVVNIDLSGADQTSIWFTQWGDTHPTMLDVANKYTYNHLPVIEAFSRQNPLLQDKVWKEDAPIGHKVTWGSRWR